LVLGSRGRPARQALRGPDFLRVIEFGKRARARRQRDPWLLRRREDVNVGRKSVWLVERPHANEMERVTCASIVAPHRDLALRAAMEFVALAAFARRGHDLGPLALDHHARRFNQGIERKGRARLTLTPTTMTTMNDERLGRHPIANGATCTTTGV